MNSTSQARTRPCRSAPRRATVAGLLGVLGAVMLAGGTGFAYATSTDAVESGYLTVVDEGTPSPATADECPLSDAPEAGAL